MKLRLIMRYGIADSDGRNVKYEYRTYVVILNEHEQVFDNVANLPEIIGGEWMLNDLSKV